MVTGVFLPPTTKFHAPFEQDIVLSTTLQEIFTQTFFFTPKNLWPKEYFNKKKLTKKNVLARNFFWLKILFDPQTFFDSKKFLTQNNFQLKLFCP